MKIEEIKAAYPNPQRSSGSPRIEEEGYCVLGAVLMFAKEDGDPKNFGRGDRFPNFRRVLQTLGMAQERSIPIFKANDTGDFERAWGLLDEWLKERAPSDDQTGTYGRWRRC